MDAQIGTSWQWFSNADSLAAFVSFLLGLFAADCFDAYPQRRRQSQEDATSSYIEN
jgi:hypothetical protein